MRNEDSRALINPKSAFRNRFSLRRRARACMIEKIFKGLVKSV
jgi:hypothetical protein